MRIIAGQFKGRRLKSPTWDGLRPTSDKLRETLFNVLAPRIGGARFLDGYAGTGAVGIEALSRGAREVTFVERERRAQQLIDENVTHVFPSGVPDGCARIRASFDRLGPFDIIFLDPPYDVRPEDAIATAAPLLTPDGVLILEHAKRAIAPMTATGSRDLLRTRQIVSGDSVLSTYEGKS